MSENQIYTIQELANLLNVDRNTITRAVDRIFPGIKKNGIRTILSESQARTVISETRKKGIAAAGPSQNEKLPEIVEISQALIKAHDIVKKYQEKIKEDRPKVEYYDQYLKADNYISIGEAAKIMGTGRTRLFKKLRAAGILNAHNIPYQEFMRYFKIVPVIIKNGKETVNTAHINSQGMAYIQKKLFKNDLYQEGKKLFSQPVPELLARAGLN